MADSNRHGSRSTGPEARAAFSRSTCGVRALRGAGQLRRNPVQAENPEKACTIACVAPYQTPSAEPPAESQWWDTFGYRLLADMPADALGERHLTVAVGGPDAVEERPCHGADQ